MCEQKYSNFVFKLSVRNEIGEFGVSEVLHWRVYDHTLHEQILQILVELWSNHIRTNSIIPRDDAVRSCVISPINIYHCCGDEFIKLRYRSTIVLALELPLEFPYTEVTCICSSMQSWCLKNSTINYYDLHSIHYNLCTCGPETHSAPSKTAY